MATLPFLWNCKHFVFTRHYVHCQLWYQNTDGKTNPYFLQYKKQVSSFLKREGRDYVGCKNVSFSYGSLCENYLAAAHHVWFKKMSILRCTKCLAWGFTVGLMGLMVGYVHLYLQSAVYGCIILWSFSRRDSGNLLLSVCLWCLGLVSPTEKHNVGRNATQMSVEQTRTNLLFTYLYLYTEDSSREIPGKFHILPNSCKKSWKIIKTMGALGVI